MSKEILKKEKNEIVEVDYSQFSAGACDDVGSEDILLPRILLQQGLSKLVTKRKAQIGDLVDSLTGDILGSIEKPLEVIIFAVNKTFEKFAKVDGKFEWAGSEPVTPQNANINRRGNEDVRIDMQFNFTCLLSDDLTLPYVFGMKVYSEKYARGLCSYFAKLKQMKKPSFATTILLLPETKENDKGEFFVLNWKAGKATTYEQAQQANEWRKIIESGKAKVHEAEGEDFEPVVEKQAEKPKVDDGAIQVASFDDAVKIITAKQIPLGEDDIPF